MDENLLPKQALLLQEQGFDAVMKLIFAVISLTLLFSSTVLAQSFPERKPGLWELKISMTGTKPKITERTSKETVSKYCIDKGTDNELFKTMPWREEKCSELKSKHEGDTFTYDYTCKIGGTSPEITLNAHVTAQGDFDKEYTETLTMKYQPIWARVSETTTVIRAKYIGPCPEDAVPGEIY